MRCFGGDSNCFRFLRRIRSRIENILEQFLLKLCERQYIFYPTEKFVFSFDDT